jgi:thiamine biosynthesis lipoprotein
MVLHGPDPVALRAAADQAFNEIERLHRQLSLYSPTSELSYINAHAAQKAVPVEPGLFGLLQRAKQINAETNGAFDITIAPLIRCWGFMGGSGALPDLERLAEARSNVGMHQVLLDERRRTVQFAREGVMLDLGSIGKGYALDAAVEELVEAGVENALIHGGTSTVYGLGSPPDEQGWKVAIEAPPTLGETKTDARVSAAGHDRAANPLAVCLLKGGSLSVSGVHGKWFRVGEKTYGHVMDPRTGCPAAGALVTAVLLPSGAESDAFSTALLVTGAAGQPEITRLRDGMRTLVAEWDGAAERLRVTGEGITPLDYQLGAGGA